MRVVIASGRGKINSVFIENSISKFHQRYGINEIIHDGSSNTSKIVSKWAQDNQVKEIIVKADYKRYGKQAVDYRNRELFKLAPDILIALPGLTKRSSIIIAAQKNYIDIIEMKIGVYAI